SFRNLHGRRCEKVSGGEEDFSKVVEKLKILFDFFTFKLFHFYMRQKIESLQTAIGGLMQRHLSKGDFETVTILSPLLSRVQALQRQCVSIDNEITEIECAVKTLRTG